MPSPILRQARQNGREASTMVTVSQQLPLSNDSAQNERLFVSDVPSLSVFYKGLMRINFRVVFAVYI